MTYFILYYLFMISYVAKKKEDQQYTHVSILDLRL